MAHRLFNMKHLLAVSLIITTALLSIAAFIGSVPTGFHILTPEVSASVEPEYAGELTGFSYQYEIDIAEMQRAVLEFTNTGTDSYEVQITAYVYYMNGTNLQELAEYIDSLAYLQPGMRKSFDIAFKPPVTGDYYIKVRVSYGYKKSITWGYFSVIIRPEIIRVFVPEGTIDMSGTSVNLITVLLKHGISLECPAEKEMTQGESILVPVRVINTGETNLSSVRFYVSSSYMLYSDVSPKLVSSILTGGDYTFIISMDADEDAEPGLYKLDATVLSNETRSNCSINVNIRKKTAEIVYDSEALRQKLLSYSYIISELESKLSYLSSQGIDVSEVSGILESAELILTTASSQLESGDYKSCMESMDAAKILLEDAYLKAGHLTLRLYAARPSVYYFIFFALLAAAVIFIAYEYRKMKNSRPRMLRKEEGSE